MKEYKTINKKPDINKFPLQKLNLHIQGKILYVTSTPYPNKKLFILTDKNVFYVIDKENYNKPKEYILQSEILRTGKLNQKNIKFQTENLESQIWTDRKGNHAIIKYKNISFYYNQFMAKKVEELNLILFNTMIQPYAVIFDDNKCENENTGIFLLSDYNSSIYEVQLFLNEKKEMMRLRFGEILKLKPEPPKRKTVTEYDFNFFEMDKDDRIVDFKFFHNEKDEILLVAITKKILFQFVGKKDFRTVFNNYIYESGNIIKAVKKFFKKSKKNDIVSDSKKDEKKEIKRTECEEKESSKFSRIQLLIRENDTFYDFFGFMSDCGYITVKINDDLKPQNKFNILKYYKINIENKENTQIVHQLMPKAVCESSNNIFFLYSNYLVVLNKLTNGIKHDEYLPYKFIDIFEYGNIMIIYNENNIYKIDLENEYKNLYEDYIEKGDYKTALELKKDDSYLMPMLHKIYADHLFDKKQYLDAALEYAFSNENFENVCIKFLNINNISGLIKYLILVIKFRLKISIPNSREKNKDRKDDINEQFIEKYLIYTWLFELLIEKNENKKDEKLKAQLKKISNIEVNGYKYLDSNLLYFLLNIYDKQPELIELAKLKKNYEIIITSLINRNKIDMALEQFKSCFAGDEGDLDTKLKNNFYKYGNLLIKGNIKTTIDLLINYFRPERPEELIRVLISPNLNILSEDEKCFNKVINYVKDLMKKSFKVRDTEINISKDQNLNNLYILLVSYSKPDKYRNELFLNLKNIINSFINNQQIEKKGSITDKIFFDLNFAKKIFKEKTDQKSKEILCLIYYLLNQYFEAIDIVIENNNKDLILYITERIQAEKFRKKIWLKIFEHEKKIKGLSEAKGVIQQSKNIIKIEDLIPLMGDDEKLIELKDELKNCIIESEKNVTKLNTEIRKFKESNELINKDIELSEKKSIRKRFTDLKCSKCDKNINKGTNTKFFLFPCQHIFDLQCLIDTYMEFNNHNLTDPNFKVKIGVIKDLSEKIRNMEERKRRAIEGKEYFGNEEDFVLNNTKKMLYDYLDEECILCSKEMVESIQTDFGKDEKFEWDLI